MSRRKAARGNGKAGTRPRTSPPARPEEVVPAKAWGSHPSQFILSTNVSSPAVPIDWNYTYDPPTPAAPPAVQAVSPGSLTPTYADNAKVSRAWLSNLRAWPLRWSKSILWSAFNG